MPEILSEYLVNIKYATDAASQNRFLEQLKKAALSVTGLAGEVAGLGVAILAMAKSMASAGEQLYWASQRIGSTAGDIQQMAGAMANLGVSSQQAMQGIEQFGAWTRNMGPAATAFLRSMGVTATDTVGRMTQLGDVFRRMGGTAQNQGSLGYSIALRYAQMMGIGENEMRALSSGQFAAQQRQQGLLQRLVWGGTDPKAGIQAFADQSQVMMNQFRQMGTIFDQLRQKFGLGLFQVLLPHLQNLNNLLIKMLPDINRLMNDLLHYVGPVMAFLEGAVKGLGIMVGLVANTIETFERLPESLKHMLEGIAGLSIGLKVLHSPVMLIIGALTTLMLLIQDYQVWKKGGTSALDWGGFDSMAQSIGKIIQPIIDIKKEIDGWIQGLTGVKDATSYLLAGGLFFGWSRLAGLIRSVGSAAFSAATGIRSVAAASEAATSAKGGAGGLALEGAGGIAARTLAGAAGFGLMGLMAAQEAKQKEKEGTLLKGYDPHGATLAPWVHRWLGGGAAPAAAPPTSTGGPTIPVPAAAPTPASGATGTGAAGQQITSTITNAAGTAGTAGAGTTATGADVQLGGDKKTMAVNTATGSITINQVDNLSLNSDSVDLSSAIGTGGEAKEGGGFLSRVGSFLGMGGDETGGYTGGAVAQQGAKEGAADLRDEIAQRFGIPKEQASAIVSNFQAESGLVANIQYGGGGIDPSSGRAIGLAQWAGSRRRALLAFAQKHGMDVSKKETQLAYMQEELNTKFPKWRQVLGSAGNDPQAIALAWYHYYESGGDPGLERYAGAHIAPARNINADTRGGTPLSSSPTQLATAAGSGTKTGQNLAVTTTNNITINDAANPQATSGRVLEAQTRGTENTVRIARGAVSY